MSLAKPFSDDLIRYLGVHIDKPVALFHADQIPLRLPLCILTFLYIDHSAGLQQFRASSGVLHMDRLFLSSQLCISKKPVRAL